MGVHAVILSGGSGTRLWPLSRASYPKQLIPLVGDISLLQRTGLRSVAIPEVDGVLVVCNQDHRFIVADQLQTQGIDPLAILLEPIPRNTAPAVALAAMQSQALSGQEDNIILVFPSDHLISNTQAFRAAVEKAIGIAEIGRLVTFGVPPTMPATGYGYIKRGSELEPGVSTVDRFVEKPELEVARKYCADGNYAWNSGMFAFRCDTYLDELNAFRPDIFEACRQSFESRFEDLDFSRMGKDAFVDCPSDSIDYAVMEKTSKAVVISMDADWDDVGSWNAVMDSGEKDTEGNVVQGDVRTLDCRNTYLRASDGRLVTAIGVEDLLIVDTPDTLLVAHRDHAQKVKDIVTNLQAEGRTEATTHRKVYRPWGSYETVDLAPRFQVKRIIVNPGQRLSLQMHHHRAEHWIVVGGTALVTRDDESFQLTENQSTFIPLGAKHRLENPGKVPLEMIEVQSGSYLGEDDIVRFEDRYGRA